MFLFQEHSSFLVLLNNLDFGRGLNIRKIFCISADKTEEENIMFFFMLSEVCCKLIKWKTNIFILNIPVNGP